MRFGTFQPPFFFLKFLVCNIFVDPSSSYAINLLKAHVEIFFRNDYCHLDFIFFSSAFEGTAKRTFYLLSFLRILRKKKINRGCYLVTVYNQTKKNIVKGAIRKNNTKAFPCEGKEISS